MLNVVQYILADESVGEKELLTARKNVRARIDRISRGEHVSNVPRETHSLRPVNEEAELRRRGLLGENVRLLPPAPPPMIPQDGPNPFPQLDPPVG